MAKVNSVVMGSASNKLGEVVLTTVKGKTIARKYQEHVNNPKTEKQVKQRNRMANCIQLYQALARGIDVGFTNRNKQLSVYNSFISNNIELMETERYDNTGEIIEDARGPIIISTGNLGSPNVTYSDEKVIVDFGICRWKLEAGDPIRVFGLNFSGEILDMITYSITESDLTNGKATIPFFTGNINNQYKCGAIIYRKHAHSSSKATLVDWTY